jgi:hypothetical protein
MVRRHFRDKLTQLSPVHMDIVFFRLDEFVDLHTHIVEGLKATKNDVGKVLMQYFADFSVYRDYCVRLSKVQAILHEEEVRSAHPVPSLRSWLPIITATVTDKFT